jgi:aminoglycoside phosphotransferase (APT) family kinase protein
MTAAEECLPEELRGGATTIAPIGAGLSGAAVYRVDAASGAFVLKISAADEPLDAWRSKLQLRRLAADAELAPRIVHVDEPRRAVVTEFVADRGFRMRMADPSTREASIEQLGRMLRRVHELPLPADVESGDALAFLADTAAAIAADFPLPPFVRDAIARVLAEAPPPAERAFVLSHNDANPTNLLLDDRERLMLVDWETASRNEPYFDLATVALFFRFDEAASLRLLTAYDSAPVAALPPRFVYDKRLVAVMSGTKGLELAMKDGYAGDANAVAPSLFDFYQRLRTGDLDLNSAEGKWQFGLALVGSAFPAERH